MRIAITGHRPDAFIQSHYPEETVVRIADDVVAVLKREHGDSLIFNLGGAIGADQWVGQACISNNVPFHLFLPFIPEVQGKYWPKAQVDMLQNQMCKARSIEITDPSGNYHVSKYHERDRRMVDEANLVIAFWVGKRQGGTFNTMKYALQQSKMVLNALDGLRPVFKENLKVGWTPPVIGSIASDE